MRRFEFKKSFVRRYKVLAPEDKVKTDRAIQFLAASLESGPLPHGLGVKKLRGDIWEMRVDIRQRICFRVKKDIIEFILLGDHDQVRDFLRDV